LAANSIHNIEIQHSGSFDTFFYQQNIKTRKYRKVYRGILTNIIDKVEVENKNVNYDEDATCLIL